MSPTHALLGLLAQGERHGYDLKRTVDLDYSPFWHIDYAQLYRSLARMTRDGWVRVRVQSGSQGPDRKIYSITERGRLALAAWLAEVTSDRDELFVKLSFGARSGSNSMSHLDTQRQMWESEFEVRKQAEERAHATGDGGQVILADAARRDAEGSLAALDLWQAIAPARKTRTAARASSRPLVITGSDDPLLSRLAHAAHSTARSVGSLGGLMALSQHTADVAGIHLLDAETGEYNVPFVKHLLPEEEILLVNLALRENGLMLAAGNPKDIRRLGDLTRRGVRFINRSRGTGTRLLLYSRLRASRIDPNSIRDWDRAAPTHEAVAAAIVTGSADVGPGLRAVAAEWGLDFLPLGEERYDLAIPRPIMESPRLRPFLASLHSIELRLAANGLSGYDLSRSGRVIARVG